MEIPKEIILEMHEKAIDINIFNSNNNNINKNSNDSNDNDINNNNSSIYFSTVNSILVLDLDTSSSSLTASSLSSSSSLVTKSLQIIQNKNISIINSTYIHNAKCFISILSDSSLVLVSESLTTSSLSEKIIFPIQPRKVIDMYDKGIAIVCDDDSIFQFKLIDITTNIKIPHKTKSNNNSSSNSNNNGSKNSIIIGNNNHITIIKQNEQNKLTLLSWQPTLLSSLSLSSSNCLWLPDATATSIILNENETVVSCRSSSHEAYSYFILLASSSSSSSSGRILKLDMKGDILFERVLTSCPTDLLTSDDKLWIVTKTGLDVWDSRYGVLHHSFTFNSSPTSCSIILPYFNNNYQYISCISTKTSSVTSTSIVRHILTIQGDDESSLCKALGKLANNINENKRKIEADNTNTNSKNKKKSKAITTEESENDFLIRIDQAKGNDIKHADWNKVKLLIGKKVVSLKANRNLIEDVARVGRADILTHIAVHISDLTEREAVRILQSYMLIPTSALKNLKLHKSTLIWNDEGTGDDDKNKNKKGGDVSKKEMTSLSLLSLLIQSLLQRRSSFSTQLLTDAVRSFQPQFAILLLRQFMFFVKGLSSSISLKSNQLIELEERQILRSIDWTEAILDAHFPAISFNCRQKPAAYQQFMKVAPGVQEMSSKLEKILGICTHIEKMADIPSHQHVVHKSSYLVESLTI